MPSRSSPELLGRSKHVFGGDVVVMPAVLAHNMGHIDDWLVRNQLRSTAPDQICEPCDGEV